MGDLTPPRRGAVALLVLAAAIWGFAFVAQRAGMAHLGPFTFNGVRFALGTASLVPLWLARRARPRRPSPAGSRLAAAASLGSVLFVAASLQQVGIVETTAGKAGFITGLYVVLVPLLGLALGQRAGRAGWIGAGLATAGLYLLSVREGLTLERGDALVLVGALFWAVHVLLLGHWSPRIDPIELSVLQFGVCALASLAVAVVLESWSVASLLAAALPLLYGGLMSVGVAYTLQVVAQRRSPPHLAAIVLSLETVFAALGGWIVLGETLGPRALVGCAFMLAGAVWSQVGPTA